MRKAAKTHFPNKRIGVLCLAIPLFLSGVGMSPPSMHEDGCSRATGALGLSPDKRPLAEVSARRDSRRSEGLEEAYCEGVANHLLAVESAGSNGVHRSVEVDLRVIRYEDFKIELYLRSGVAPKAYFGFFDEEGDTAAYETELRRTIIDVVPIINVFAIAQNIDIQVSEKELALTFLAEGGALLLTTPEDSPDRVHPVRGIGLDDFRKGFARYPTLIKSLDAKFGTRLDGLLVQIVGRPVLVRPMTYREAILGTAVMYLFEKQIALALLKKEAEKTPPELSGTVRPPLKDAPLDVQFITTSLVYNSGVLFSAERVAQILAFDTGEYLAEVNQKSDRPKLPVRNPSEASRLLKEKRQIPRQLTSWSAVYHILQRYGAWVALEKFSNTFVDGQYRNRL